MGCSGSKKDKECSEETKKVLDELFKRMDQDGDGNITRAEAIKYWGKKFAKVSADQMFGQTDEDTGGTIQYEEYMKFWREVRNNGYEDAEIAEEANNMLNGEAWRDWGRVSITKSHDSHSKNNAG
mmetsp:Transcript_88344/g.152988  ORF Transcript_88344/g.152988 Transcript_88344/m.152988 type:complete len:125 (-) Transcript_88344:285-659(-)